MALDFPANPVNGQAYGSYIYNSSVGAWQSKEDPATVATVSTVPPASANPGDIWYDSDDGTSYLYYDDGTSAQWVELLSSGLPLLDTKANIAGDTFTGNVTAPRFISNQATGTAPFTVSSTTAVTNLNADLLDGQHASSFSPVAGSSSITAVGTVTSGTWNGSTIEIARGGTGATTVAQAQTNLEVPLSPNYIINGGFDIWQRGTSITNNTSYLADRWYITANATSVSCNQSRVAANLSGKAGYALRVQQTASSTVVEYAARQFIEAQNLFPLAGKTVTLSFWYRSNKTGTHGARLTGSGRATGATDLNIGFTVSAANTWGRYSITFSTFAGATAWTVSDNEWGAALDIGFRTGNSVGHTSLAANDYFEITGVQLEEGSVATSFRRNANSIQGENAACQRYYHRISSTTQFTALALGYQITNTEVAAFVTLPVRMRIRPTASISNIEWSDNALYSIGVSNFQTNTASTQDQVRINANISSNGSQFRPGTFRTASSSLGFIDFNAEL
jgi:hypothetical protein